MIFEKEFKKIWFKLKDELFKNHYDLLWEEAGIRNLIFHNALNILKNDFKKRSLVISEYSPKPPKDALECKVHIDHLKELRKGEWNTQNKVDLAILDFGKDINKIKNGNDCNYWCYKPQKIYVFEFKYIWLEKIIKSNADINNDIRKLNELVNNWNTNLAYLCIITDIENLQDFNEVVNSLKNKISKNNINKFRIALGSYKKDDSELWKIE